MPLGDRTGPLGLGPMTGRGLGYCAGYSHPGYMNPAGRFSGRGMGWRRGWWGWGRGWGWRWPVFQAPPTAEEEKEVLNEELKTLKEEMKAVENRIKELETKKKEK